MYIEPNQRFKMVVATNLVLMKGNQVLLGKRQNTGWSDGKYSLVGGHVEEGELALAAVVREAAEELGVQIDPKDVSLAHVTNTIRSDHSRMELFFSASRWTGEIKNNEPDLCSELTWFEITELPTDITFDSRDALNNINQRNNYSEINDRT